MKIISNFPSLCTLGFHWMQGIQVACLISGCSHTKKTTNVRNSLLQLVFDPPSVKANLRHMAGMLLSSLLSTYLTFQPEEMTPLWHLFRAPRLHILNSCCHSHTLPFVIVTDSTCSGIADFSLNRQTGSKNSYSASAFHLYVDPWHSQMGNACCTVKPSQRVCHLCHSVN